MHESRSSLEFRVTLLGTETVSLQFYLANRGSQFFSSRSILCIRARFRRFETARRLCNFFIRRWKLLQWTANNPGPRARKPPFLIGKAPELETVSGTVLARALS